MIKDRNALIIMAKAPQLGNVKTRLDADIGKKNALGIYKNFLKDLSKRILPNKNCVKYVFFTPSHRVNLLEPFFSVENGFILKPQCEGNLGDKLADSFKRLFNDGFSNIVVIGTDSPDIPIESIDRAFSYLVDNKNSKNAVIGPTEDGGYYLLGLNSREDGVFKDITWSSDLVFSETVKNFKKHSFSYEILPKWYDIDDKNGLKRLISENIATNSVDFAKEVTSKS